MTEKTGKTDENEQRRLTAARMRENEQRHIEAMKERMDKKEAQRTREEKLTDMSSLQRRRCEESFTEWIQMPLVQVLVSQMPPGPVPEALPKLLESAFTAGFTCGTTCMIEYVVNLKSGNK